MHILFIYLFILKQAQLNIHTMGLESIRYKKEISL